MKSRWPIEAVYAQGLAGVAEIELLPRRLADYAGDALLVDQIVARQPDVLGVSLYTWNSERSLDIIQRVYIYLKTTVQAGLHLD